MRAAQVILLSYKKLKNYRLKTVFLVLPIALLLAIGTALTAEAQNVQRAISGRVIAALQSESQFLQIVQQNNNSLGSLAVIGGQGQQPYSENDVQRIESIKGVSKADLGVQVPLGQATTTDLVPGHTLTLNSITALDSSLSAQFAEQSTAYNGHGPIPIILSASQFQETVENWRGLDSIQVSLSLPSGGKEVNANVDLNNSGGPVGTRAIPYNRQSLIGKEFTLSIGGLAPVQDYSIQSGGRFGQLTYQKSSATQLSQQASARQAAIAPYWDYNKISTPQAYTFKVVGIIDNQASQTAYIPSQAAQQLMHGEVQAELDASTGASIPSSALGSTFTGLNFDGTSLSASAGASGAMMFGGGPATASYTIPGLVVQTDNSGQPTGIVTDPDVYAKAVPTSTSLFVKLASVYDRSHVVSTLNSAGYAYQDTSKLDTLLNLKQRLSTYVAIFVWLFGGAVVLTLVLAFSRFVADSRREIGIFRALGATKGEVGNLFVAQAVLTGVASYVLGMPLGVGATAAIAGSVSSWFNGIVRDTVNQSALSRVLTTGDSFAHIDWSGVMILSVLLWGAIVMTACVASIAAARVSPAEAVKSE